MVHLDLVAGRFCFVFVVIGLSLFSSSFFSLFHFFSHLFVHFSLYLLCSLSLFFDDLPWLYFHQQLFRTTLPLQCFVGVVLCFSSRRCVLFICFLYLFAYYVLGWLQLFALPLPSIHPSIYLLPRCLNGMNRFLFLFQFVIFGVAVGWLMFCYIPFGFIMFLYISAKL